MKKVLLAVLCIILCVALCGCFKSKEVKAVEAAIADIGHVTRESGTLIAEAEDLYDDLSAEDKEKVENYDLLVDAREDYDLLCVSYVEGLIDDIGTVTIDSAAAIEEARAEYDALPQPLQEQVGNIDLLDKAEEDYELAVLLDANVIKNYSYISAYKVNLFKEDAKTWYGDLDAAATLFICFCLQGGTDNLIDISKTEMSEVYVCLDNQDSRVDVYLGYGEGQVLGIQYWPDKKSAQFGFADTELTVLEYVQLLQKGEIFDSYQQIPLSNMIKILNIMR